MENVRIPQSEMQRSIFLECLKNENQSSYLVQSIYSLKGTLNLELLVTAAGKMLERYPIFRTSFLIDDQGRCVQNVNAVSKVSPQYSFLDLSDVENPDLMFKAFLKEDAGRFFSFNDLSMIRGTVVRFKDSSKIVFSYHHILLDGWSAGIAQNSFFDMYDNLNQGIPVECKEDNSFQSFCENDYSELNNEDLVYWKNILSGMKFLSKNVQNVPSETMQKTVFIDKGKSEMINSFAADCQVTVTCVLLSLYMESLAKTKGLADVCVGVVNSGRNVDIEMIEESVGCFMRIIPIRVSNILNEDFVSVCKNVQYQIINGAFVHDFSYSAVDQIFPGNEQVELFEELFLAENYPVEQKQRKTFEVTGHEALDNNTFPLVSYFYNDRELGQIEVEYQFLDNISEEYNELNKNLIGMVQKMEQKQYEDDFTESITKSLLRHSEKLAIVYGKKSISYNQLQKRATILANRLRTMSNEKFIGIYMDSSIDAIISIIAVILSGKAYVPIDPNMPDARVEYIINDSDVNLLLVNNSVQLEINYSGDVLDINTLDYENIASLGYFESEDEAYMIYTSGSTGNPKGVVISRDNIVGFLKWNNDYMKYSSNDIVLQNHSLSFDNSVWEIFSALLNGGKLIIPEDRRNIEETIELIAKNKVTSLSVTPSQLSVLLEYVDFVDKTALLSLTRLFVGSETVPYQVVENAFNYLNDKCCVYNEYGPTETTITSSVFEIKRNALKKLANLNSIPIGMPVANNKYYILPQESNEIVNLSTNLDDGELYIGGPRVALEYYKNKEKTAGSFFEFEGERLYKTGDLVNVDENGIFSFIGRVDDQIKVRGFRIELGEVESAMRQLAEINEVAVVAVFDSESATNTLVAYYTSNISITVGILRKQLSLNLPSYMIPSHFNKVDHIPLNSNGKIDKKRLKDMPNSHSIEVESKSTIHDVFVDVLNISGESWNRSFLQLGGDSLKCAKIVGVLKGRGIDISFADLFSTTSLESYVNKLKNINDVNTDSDRVALNYTQKEIVVDSLENTHSKNVYLQSTVFHLNFKYSSEEVIKVCSKLVELHSNVFGELKLVENDFVIKSFTPLEYIQKAVLFYNLTDSDISEEIKRQVSLGINLFDDPLIKVIVNFNENGTTIAINFHQLVLDGISFNNLANEFIYGLEQVRTSATPLKIPTGVSFNSLEEDRNSRRELIENIEEKPIFDTPLTHIPADKTININDEQLEVMKAFCVENNITLNTFFFGLYVRFIELMSQKNEFVIGMAIDGRNPNIKDVYSAVGNFIQTLIFKKNNSDDSQLEINNFTLLNQYLMELYEKSYSFNYRQEVNNFQNSRLDAMYSYHGYSFKDYAAEISFSELSSHDILPYAVAVAVVPEKNGMTVLLSVDEALNDSYIDALSSISDELRQLLQIGSNNPNRNQTDQTKEIVLRVINEFIPSDTSFSINSSFVESGLNSLSLAVIYRRLCEEGLKFSYADLLKSENTAQFIKKIKPHVSLKTPSFFEKELSSAQRSILLSILKTNNELGKPSTVFCQQSIYKLRHKLSLEQVRKYTGQLMERHPTLRSVINIADTTQKFYNTVSNIPISLNIVDNETQRESILRQNLEEVALLDSKWLFNISLIQFNSKFELVFSYSHLILDGLSENIVLNELFSALKQNEDIEGVNNNYLNWLDHNLSKVQSQSAYWKDKQILLGKDKQKGEKAQGLVRDYEQKKVEISGELLTNIKQISVKNNFTRNSIILSYVMSALNENSPSEVGNIDINIADEGFEELVGCTVKTIPLIVDNLKLNNDPATYISKELVDLQLELESGTSNQIPQVSNDVLYSYEYDLDNSHLDNEILESSFSESINHKLSINVLDTDEKIALTFVYDSMNVQYVEKFMECLNKLIQSNSSSKKMHITELEIFPDKVVKDTWKASIGDQLKNVEINSDTTFWDIGGTSLQLFNVSKVFQDKWKIKITIPELLENMTFQQLTSLVKKKQS